MREMIRTKIFYIVVITILSLIGGIGGYHVYKYIGVNIKHSRIVNDVVYSVSFWAIFGFLMGILILPEIDD